eukprot:TRINITY_DN6248_c0_g1_i1.p1 TRINITY_DN6248_c0_g1~~TRINITY_DN6248_c0_g1_i1.p1  ORF type:complete len:147 (-),score=28.78 TRINITY_DN6248_c0_g1_i1:58-498(-)
MDSDNEMALNIIDHYIKYKPHEKFFNNFHKPFIFLSIINWETEKLILEKLIESYLLEFKHRERVLLLILIEDEKSHDIHNQVLQLHKKATKLPETSEIWISNDHFDGITLKKLFKSSNCFVLPNKYISYHHLSSMLLGVPIIVIFL